LRVRTNQRAKRRHDSLFPFPWRQNEDVAIFLGKRNFLDTFVKSREGLHRPGPKSLSHEPAAHPPPVNNVVCLSFRICLAGINSIAGLVDCTHLVERTISIRDDQAITSLSSKEIER